jgi:hypothetical protein
MDARRSSLLAAGTLAVGLVVAACGGTAATPAASTAATSAPATVAPTTAPTDAPSEAAPSVAASSPSTEGRTGRVEVAGEQVAITLPDGWIEVVLTGDDLQSMLDAYPEGTFSEEQQAMMRAALSAGMKLMAFDSDAKGSNLNLLIQPAEVPLDLLSAALEAQLAAIPGASGIEIDQFEVDGENGLLATYDLDQELADGTKVAMSGTQLYVSTNGRLYVFTLTLADGATQTPADVLGTIEFLE